MSRILSENNNRSICRVLMAICFIFAAIAALCCVIAFSGRVSVTGHSNENLLFSNGQPLQGIFIKLYDIHFAAANEGKAHIFTWLIVCAMAAIKFLPFAACFIFLGIFFKNIGSGEFFIEKNGKLLVQSGICLLFIVIPATLINTFFFPFLINRLTGDYFSVFAAVEIPTLVLGLSLLAGAYVFSYGTYLQDEVNLTL